MELNKSDSNSREINKQERMEYGAKEPGMNVCVPGIAMLVHISGL